MILRSTIAPGTTEFVAGYLRKRRGLEPGVDIHVAHCPERIAEGRFLEEIYSFPCIVAGVTDACADRAAELFSRFGTEIVPTTPVQAELAKIWANIYRYATFALPNLLMMNCEQYGANVFEVIDLVNHDYPRERARAAWLHGRNLLAQGLRVFGGTLERARYVAGGLSRQRICSALHRRRSQAAPGRFSHRPPSGGPRDWHSKPTRTMSGTRSRSSWSACWNASWRMSRCTTATCRRPTQSARRSVAWRRCRRRLQRTIPSSRTPTCFARIRELAGPECVIADPWNAIGTGSVFAPAARGPRDRLMAAVLVTGAAGTIGSAVVRRLTAEMGWTVRRLRPVVPSLTGCESATPFIPETCASSMRLARRWRVCDRVIHLAAIVGRYTPTSTSCPTRSARSTLRSTTPSSARRFERDGLERFVYVSSSMVFERSTSVSDARGLHRRNTDPSIGVWLLELTGEIYTLAAHEEFGLPYTICRPFNAYGPGEMPEDEPGIAHMVPDIIKKVLSGQQPLEIFGSGEQTRTLTYVDDIADGIVTAMLHPAGLNEDFNISAGEELTVAEIARVIWEACGRAPEDFGLEHMPTYRVDVQRRWPSVHKARTLLGWEAQTELRDGVRLTADWLRSVLPTA